MKPIEIAAQVVSVMAMAMNILSYQNKKQQMIFVFQLMGAGLFATSYFLLNAYTGAVLNIVGIVRALVFINKKRLKADHPLWLIAFSAASVASYVLTFTVLGKELTVPNLLVELLPVAGMVITTYSFQLKDAKSVRAFGAINSPLWMIYNIVNLSIGGICCEVFSLISIVVGYFRYDTKKKQGEK